MASRMDRYNSNQDNSVSSRTSKNKKLYDDLYTNTSYTQFISAGSFHNSIHLDDEKKDTDSKRERYQNSKKVSSFMSTAENGNSSTVESNYYNVSKFSSLIDDKKVHDINQVLADAKKNRNDEDSLERKRKLRTTEYDILTELSSEKVKEYKERQKSSLQEEQEDLESVEPNLETKDDGQDLLDDLMPNPLDETIVTEPILESDTTLDTSVEVENEDLSVVEKEPDNSVISTADIKEAEEVEVLDETVIRLDESFYTKSMDLSEYDLVKELDGNEQEPLFLKKSKKHIILKVIAVILIVAILIGIGFVIFHYINL